MQLRQWLDKGAAIYVCMAAGIDQVLREAAVEALSEEGRYRRDVY